MKDVRVSQQAVRGKAGRPTSGHLHNVNTFMRANYVNGYVFISKRAATKNFVIVFIFLALFEYDFAGTIVNHLHWTFEMPIMN